MEWPTLQTRPVRVSLIGCVCVVGSLANAADKTTEFAKKEGAEDSELAEVRTELQQARKELNKARDELDEASASLHVSTGRHAQATVCLAFVDCPVWPTPQATVVRLAPTDCYGRHPRPQRVSSYT